MGENESPVWIDTEAFRARAKTMKRPALGIAMDVFCALTLGGQQAFTFDAKEIARVASRPAHPCSVKEVLSLKADILKIFVPLPDGRYAADPALFSVTDPYGEMAA